MSDIRIGEKVFLTQEQAASPATLESLIEHLTEALDNARQVRDRLASIGGPRGYQLLEGDADLLRAYVQALEESMVNAVEDHGNLQDLTTSIYDASDAESAFRDGVAALADSGQVIVPGHASQAEEGDSE